MDITQEMIEALAHLRAFSTAVKAERGALLMDKDAALAIDLLDGEGFFAPIDEAGECSYQVAGSNESPPEYCGLDIEPGKEFCAKHQRLADLDTQPYPVDPAEWGDTTREDMARHQQQG